MMSRPSTIRRWMLGACAVLLATGVGAESGQRRPATPTTLPRQAMPQPRSTPTEAQTPTSESLRPAPPAVSASARNWWIALLATLAGGLGAVALLARRRGRASPPVPTYGEGRSCSAPHGQTGDDPGHRSHRAVAAAGESETTVRRARRFRCAGVPGRRSAVVRAAAVGLGPLGSARAGRMHNRRNVQCARARAARAGRAEPHRGDGAHRESAGDRDGGRRISGKRPVFRKFESQWRRRALGRGLESIPADRRL